MWERYIDSTPIQDEMVSQCMCTTATAAPYPYKSVTVAPRTHIKSVTMAPRPCFNVIMAPGPYDARTKLDGATPI